MKGKVCHLKGLCDLYKPFGLSRFQYPALLTKKDVATKIYSMPWYSRSLQNSYQSRFLQQGTVFLLFCLLRLPSDKFGLTQSKRAGCNRRHHTSQCNVYFIRQASTTEILCSMDNTKLDSDPAP